MKDEGKHAKIIAAAVKVFAEKGFHNARVSEIAREAKVADGTIYLYFKNKDDILISMFEQELGKIVEDIRQDLEQEKDPLKKIERLVMNHLSMVTKQRQLTEVLGIEVRQSAKFMKKYVNKPFMEYLDLIRSLITEGQEQGLIRQELAPGIMKRALFGALDEMVRYWLLSTQSKHSISEAAKQISDVFILGMMTEKAQKLYPRQQSAVSSAAS